MSAEPDLSSWSLSLEDVARSRWGRSFRPRSESLAFAPKLVREPRAYDRTPAVMLVASSASALLHRPFFDAVELLEKATGAFKVVVFTDSPTSSELREYDWTVEHCMAEPDWETVSTSNWLEMAGKRLIWASRVYKPALTLASNDGESAISEIRRLGNAFAIGNAVVEGALGRLRAGLESPEVSEHPTLRGWIGKTTLGEESTHRLRPAEYIQTELRIVRRRGRIVLITPDSEASRDLNRAATDHDWSVVRVFGLNQVKHSAKKRLLRTVNSAFEDTLTFYLGTEPTPDVGTFFDGGRIEFEKSAATYNLEIKHVGSRKRMELGRLIKTLVNFSTADQVAKAIL